MLPDRNTPPTGADAQDGWARPVSVGVGGAVLALALAGTGVFFAWQALYLSFGGVGLPGPGFFPFALGIALVAVALVLLYTVRNHGDDGEVAFIGHRNVLVTLAALAYAAFAFERLGAYATLGAFAAAMLLVVARTTFSRAVLGAALGVVAVWLFFGIVLGVRLPDGTVWEQLADAFAAASTSDQP